MKGLVSASILGAMLVFSATREPCKWQPGKSGVVDDYIYHTYSCPTTPELHKITICCVDNPGAKPDAERLKLMNKVEAQADLRPHGPPVPTPGKHVVQQILIKFLPKPAPEPKEQRK